MFILVQHLQRHVVVETCVSICASGRSDSKHLIRADGSGQVEAAHVWFYLGARWHSHHTSGWKVNIICWAALLNHWPENTSALPFCSVDNKLVIIIFSVWYPGFSETTALGVWGQSDLKYSALLFRAGKNSTVRNHSLWCHDLFEGQIGGDCNSYTFILVLHLVLA